LDENETNASGFEQNEKLIELQNSINLKYSFIHKNKKHIGWINVLNPFRATSIVGTPGSGKTYAVLEEYMRQLTFKGFSGVFYDYKDPALSRQAYNYLMQYAEGTKNKTIPEFAYISFIDLNRTKRCNPLNGIDTSAEAVDFATVILTALNKKFAEQQGEFFVESAKTFTALAIYFLGIVHNGRFQSLPHLLSLVGRKADIVFPAFKLVSIFYPDMQMLFNPFSEAFDKNVIEQLQGQLASAQIGLGTMSDKELAWIMTEDEEHPEWNVDLDINSITHPKILCIGNASGKDIILGLACSVYLSRIAKIINKKGTPVQFFVDELPTVYIKGLDTLISTARSNKVAVVLGFQDLSQLTRDYGEKIAKVVWGTVANIFSGGVKGDSAKKLAESFGEKKVLKISKTVNSDGNVTINYQEAKEKKIPADVIEELDQGEFVGRVAGEFGYKIKNKVFYGEININPDYKKMPLEIPLLRNLTKPEQDEMTLRNLIKITNEISEMLSKVNDLAEDYNKLKAYTYKAKKKEQEQAICLETFIENPDDAEAQKHFYLWIEQAYLIIVNLRILMLKNDILSFEEKFELLLRDVYVTTSTNLQLVQEYRRRLNVETLEQVQAVNKSVYEQEIEVAEPLS
jgi:hypothetical protein